MSLKGAKETLLKAVSCMMLVQCEFSACVFSLELPCSSQHPNGIVFLLTEH